MSATFLIPAALLAVPAVLIGIARGRDKLRAILREASLERHAPDPHDPGTWDGVSEMAEPALRPLPVVHFWPAKGSDKLDCCGGDPFEPGQLITFVRERVTCPGGDT